MRRVDPHRALIRALTARYAGLLVLASRTEPWASATFTGARHVLTCDDGIDLASIEDAEFDLPGHFVADIAVVGGEHVTIDALTIESARCLAAGRNHFRIGTVWAGRALRSR